MLSLSVILTIRRGAEFILSEVESRLAQVCAQPALSTVEARRQQGMLNPNVILSLSKDEQTTSRG
jgi:hypothetical protein